MSNHRPGSLDKHGDVFDIACARFEAELANGEVSRAMREHAEGCARCTALKREVEDIAALLGQVSKPVRIDHKTTLDSVLERAAVLDGRLAEAPRGPSWRASWTMGLGVVAIAAITLLTLQLPDTTSNTGEAHVVEPRPVARGLQPSLDSAPVISFASRETQRTRSEHQPRLGSSTATLHDPAPAPQVLPTEASHQEPNQRSKSEVNGTAPYDEEVPEPKVDLSAEISAMVHERIRANERCPTEASAPVWVTMTIRADGSLTNRQIVSDGDASLAHRCVAKALDELLVAPGTKTRTLSFEVSW